MVYAGGEPPDFGTGATVVVYPLDQPVRVTHTSELPQCSRTLPFWSRWKAGPIRVHGNKHGLGLKHRGGVNKERLPQRGRMRSYCKVPGYLYDTGMVQTPFHRAFGPGIYVLSAAARTRGSHRFPIVIVSATPCISKSPIRLPRIYPLVTR